MNKKGDAEQAFFFGDPAEPNFGTLHAPTPNTEKLNLGVVLCSPLAHEFDFSYRMHVEWARSLTKLGLWVLRFDYRGHGDSGGTFSQYTLDDFEQDIRHAVDALEQRAGVPCWALCGMRLGATLAVKVWAEDPRPGPIILWEPVLQGKQYFDELLLALLAKYMKQQVEQRPTRAELKQRIAEGGEVVFEGRAISRGLADSLQALDLEIESSRLSKPTLLVQIRKKTSTPATAQFVKLHEELRKHCRVDLITVAAPPPWFGSLVLDYATRVSPPQLFEPTQHWLSEQLAADASLARSPHESTCHQSTLEPARRETEQLGSVWTSEVGGADRPIKFDVDGSRCTGMLHVAGRVDPDRPVIVFPPQGMNYRAGWNQLHVQLARALGMAGWASLRFDARGLGSAAGELEFATGADLFVSVQEGSHMPETSAAMSWIERELGIRKIILVGICGGAVTACFLAAKDPRVAAAALIEMPLCYSRHPSEREGKPLWQYREQLFSVEAWRKLLTLQADYLLHLRSLGLVARRVLGIRSQDGVSHHFLFDRLGEAANVKLADSLQRCCARDIPLLITYGSTDNAEMYEQVKSAFCSRDSAQKTEQNVEGADHDFLLPQHSRALSDILHEWLGQSFDCDSEAAPFV